MQVKIQEIFVLSAMVARSPWLCVCVDLKAASSMVLAAMAVIATHGL